MRVDGPGDQDGRRLHRMPTEGVFVGGMAMNTQESQVHLPPVQCWQQDGQAEVADRDGLSRYMRCWRTGENGSERRMTGLHYRGGWLDKMEMEMQRW